MVLAQGSAYGQFLAYDEVRVCAFYQQLADASTGTDGEGAQGFNIAKIAPRFEAKQLLQASLCVDLFPTIEIGGGEVIIV